MQRCWLKAGSTKLYGGKESPNGTWFVNASQSWSWWKFAICNTNTYQKSLEQSRHLQLQKNGELRQREKLVDMGNVRYFKLCRSKVAVIGLACEAVKLSQVSCHAEVERLRILTSGLRSYLCLVTCLCLVNDVSIGPVSWDQLVTGSHLQFDTGTKLNWRWYNSDGNRTNPKGHPQSQMYEVMQLWWKYAVAIWHSTMLHSCPFYRWLPPKTWSFPWPRLIVRG